MSETVSSGIPVIHVKGTKTPEVWERSIARVLSEGIDVESQHDFTDEPPTKDCTAVMEIDRPMDDPVVHVFLPCGLGRLEEYRRQVVEGACEHLLGKPGYEYTYYQRLFRHSTKNPDREFIDQINQCYFALRESPHTRRAQAVTWELPEDAFSSSPPCLQRIWFRANLDGEGRYVLNMHTSMRSNDALKAAPMNLYAFQAIQYYMIQKLNSDGLGGKGKVVQGKHVHWADSYHIYGRDHEDAVNVVRSCVNRSFEGRTYNSSDILEAVI